MRPDSTASFALTLAEWRCAACAKAITKEKGFDAVKNAYACLGHKKRNSVENDGSDHAGQISTKCSGGISRQHTF